MLARHKAVSNARRQDEIRVRVLIIGNLRFELHIWVMAAAVSQFAAQLISPTSHRMYHIRS
jgi:hypothetical protein